MFESDFIERFSRIHPATPFVFWIPVLVWLLVRNGLAYAEGSHAVGWFSTVALVGAGVLAWTFAEYILHRWVFHWTNGTAFGKRFHFLIHGVHHDFPTDKDRLVMPLGVSIPLGIAFYMLFAKLFPAGAAVPFFVGFTAGYLAYDGIHFAVHHFAMKSRLARWVKRHHMLHHHADHDGGFGVSSPLWDVVFRTMPEPARGRSRAAARKLAA
jgi:sterol desaturase/sphingolipid hydroxylase (fatty acid hydroxylase superfamily)